MTISTALHRVSVGAARGIPDVRGAKVKQDITDNLSLTVDDVRVVDVYTLPGDLSPDETDRLGRELFANPVVESFVVDDPLSTDFDWLLEVGYRPGVTDNPGRTAHGAASDLLGRDVGQVFTSRQYLFKGDVNKESVQRIASSLSNDLIERCTVIAKDGWVRQAESLKVAPVVDLQHKPQVQEIDLDVSDKELERLNAERTLALTLEELRTIGDYYRSAKVTKERRAQGLPASPTDVELEALAQTWSEHCKHKIFNAEIDYTEDGRTENIRSLFKTYIKRATDEIGQRVDWLVSVFTDNAGIVKFTDDWNLVMKVETHNSPSALDPYGGAITGILGVNRDTLGTGMGSELIFNTDVFCFASPFYNKPLPPKLLPPKRIFESVRHGVEHGGNKLGVPTVNGSVVFDDRFLGKPLVYCGTGGLIPATVAGRPSETKAIAPGDLAVMCGGRIGKDGIHGATFSSEELHKGSPATAVQIGDPITQKNMFDFLIEARDQGLFKTLTDNGAGGLSSSIGEMAQISGGCDIHLADAPLKYPGLDPWEILISEAQERMTVIVAPDKVDKFLALSKRREVESTVVGKFTDSGRFDVHFGQDLAGSLDLEFLHHGLPPLRLKAVWQAPQLGEPEIRPGDFSDELKGLLGRLNICSKERVVRQYDHEVQGTSVVKPLTGAKNDGPSDAGVVRPLLDRREGVVVSHGICPRFSDIDTYHMTANAIDEAVRNAVATGADPDRLAGLDNFCWCDPVASPKNPDGEYKAAQLVRANRALYDYCLAFGVPCISGKDSMKNDYIMDGTKISIPPTVLFTVVGRINDVDKAVTMDAKQAGDKVYVLGLTKLELGGSEYFAKHGQVGASVPQVDAAAARARYQALHQAMQQGLVASAHDCSDGGLAVALAETAFAGGFGMSIDLRTVPVANVKQDDQALFSESASRLVVTVRPNKASDFETAMADTGWAQIGEVRSNDKFIVTGLFGKIIIDTNSGDLKTAWQKTLGV